MKITPVNIGDARYLELLPEAFGEACQLANLSTKLPAAPSSIDGAGEMIRLLVPLEQLPVKQSDSQNKKYFARRRLENGSWESFGPYDFENANSRYCAFVNASPHRMVQLVHHFESDHVLRKHFPKIV